VFSPVDVPLLPCSRQRRLAAISHQPPTFLTAVSRLRTLNGSWHSLYSPDTDRTENTASNSYSIVAYYTAVTEQWLFLWLHSSCFEPICYCIYIKRLQYEQRILCRFTCISEIHIPNPYDECHKILDLTLVHRL
jgi:hypothetical protein